MASARGLASELACSVGHLDLGVDIKEGVDLQRNLENEKYHEISRDNMNKDEASSLATPQRVNITNLAEKLIKYNGLQKIFLFYHIILVYKTLEFLRMSWRNHGRN